MKKLSEKDRRLHQQFSQYGKSAREWMRKCILLLPEIERNRVWEKKGFFSIYEYAAKLAGMSRETVNESLRVLKKIEDKPELLKIVEEKGYLAVRPVACVATKENAGFWAEKAKIMSKNTLEMYVREIRKSEGNDGRPRTAKIIDFARQGAISTIQLSSKMKEKLEKLKGEKSWDNLFEQLLELHENEVEKLKKEAEKKFEETKMNSTVSHKRYKAKSRYIPTKIKKYIISKTNGTCAFLGCTKQAEILHHTERFAITHRHDPNKIAPLCEAHERIAHEGLIENENEEPIRWSVCQYPDTADYKYFIDSLVAGHRAK